MRKMAIIAIAGALGLTGCTMMGHDRSGDRRHSEFPSTYQDGKPQYKSAPHTGASHKTVYPTNPDTPGYRSVEVISERVKEVLENELKGLRKRDLAFVAIIDPNDGIRLLKGNEKKSNHLTTQQLQIKN